MPRLWAVFDIDGTISNCDHRVALARSKQWDLFHQACAEDPPHLAEVMIAQAWVQGRAADLPTTPGARSRIAR
jgi:hypothetical protein